MSKGQFQFGPWTGCSIGMKCTERIKPVGTHRVDDVLCVGTGARIVVDLGADRVAHPAAQAFGDDLRVADVDVRGLRGAVEVAGLRELERAANEIDRRRVLEGQRSSCGR